MTKPLTRSRRRPDGSTLIEIELEFLFTSTMLIHIERLPQLHVVSKRSWALSDSFEACFCYKGHRFLMGIPFGNIMITAESASTPCEIFEEIIAHVERYRTVWPHQFAWGVIRYFFLPITPPPCKHAPVQGD